MGKFTQNVYGMKWVKVLYCLILLRLMRLRGVKITERGRFAAAVRGGIERRESGKQGDRGQISAGRRNRAGKRGRRSEVRDQKTKILLW
jgi:hypothetical protein